MQQSVQRAFLQIILWIWQSQIRQKFEVENKRKDLSWQFVLI